MTASRSRVGVLVHGEGMIANRETAPRAVDFCAEPWTQGRAMWDTGAMQGPTNADASAPAEGGRPKVIYVMGSGRSGSTILGVALGNCENVFFAGELYQWLMRSGTPALDDPPRRRFWARVREDVEVPPQLAGGAASRLERSSALLHPRKRIQARRLRARYRRVSEQLLRTVARTADVTHIVDTSHYPLRARELRSLTGIDVYLLFLVRDPHGIVASLAREDVPERTFGLWSANAYVWLTNLMATIVFLGHPRTQRLLVRHEHFLANPEHVLSEILRTSGSPASTPDLHALRSGLPFHGNRLIAVEQIPLERPSEAPVRRSLVTSVLQLPWTLVISLLRPATRASTPHEHAGFNLESADAHL
jgi:hypothetical protein